MYYYCVYYEFFWDRRYFVMRKKVSLGLFEFWWAYCLVRINWLYLVTFLFFETFLQFPFFCHQFVIWKFHNYLVKTQANGFDNASLERVSPHFLTLYVWLMLLYWLSSSLTSLHDGRGSKWMARQGSWVLQGPNE